MKPRPRPTPTVYHVTNEPAYTCEQVAAMTGWSSRTLQHWCRMSYLPEAALIRRRWHISHRTTKALCEGNVAKLHFPQVTSSDIAMAKFDPDKCGVDLR
jgi:hypothetical protein